MNYQMCWLTLNRACNLRCKWCYAKSTEFQTKDTMSIDMAKQIVDICKDLKVNYIALIGGEPTLYKELPEIIDYIHNKDMDCGIITNGLKFADNDFLQSLFDVGMNHFSVSLKGENQAAFKDVTGYDGFEQVKQGIKNCLEKGASVSVSMVLTEENIETYLEGIREMKELGVKNFHLSFCYELDTSPEYKQYLKTHNPKQLIDKFVESYTELDKITEHNFSLFQGYPLCLWDKSIIELMNQRSQLTTVCQLLHRDGLIFDPNGQLIPCNAMPDIKLGKLNSDFNDAGSLLEYSSRKDFVEVYDYLCSIPSCECADCDDLSNCGGGCVCQWTNYSFEQLLNTEDENNDK